MSPSAESLRTPLLLLLLLLFLLPAVLCEGTVSPSALNTEWMVRIPCDGPPSISHRLSLGDDSAALWSSLPPPPDWPDGVGDVTVVISAGRLTVITPDGGQRWEPADPAFWRSVPTLGIDPLAPRSTPTALDPPPTDFLETEAVSPNGAPGATLSGGGDPSKKRRSMNALQAVGIGNTLVGSLNSTSPATSISEPPSLAPVPSASSASPDPASLLMSPSASPLSASESPSPASPSPSPSAASSSPSPSTVSASSSFSVSPSPSHLLPSIPRNTPAATASPTASPNTSPSPTASPSPNPSPSPNITHTPTPTPEVTLTGTPTLTQTPTPTEFCGCCSECGLSQNLIVRLPAMTPQPTLSTAYIAPTVSLPPNCAGEPAFAWTSAPTVSAVTAQSSLPSIAIGPNTLSPQTTYALTVTATVCQQTEVVTTLLTYVAPPRLAAGPSMQVNSNGAPSISGGGTITVTAGDWIGNGSLLYAFGYQLPAQPRVTLAALSPAPTATFTPPFVASTQTLTVLLTVQDSATLVSQRVGVPVTVYPAATPPGSNNIRLWIASGMPARWLMAAQSIALSPSSPGASSLVDLLLQAMSAAPLGQLSASNGEAVAAALLALSTLKTGLSAYAQDALGSLSTKIAQGPAASPSAGQSLLLALSNTFYAVVGISAAKFTTLATPSTTSVAIGAAAAAAFRPLTPGQSATYNTPFVNVALCHFLDLSYRSPNRTCTVGGVQAQVLAVDSSAQPANILIQAFNINPLSAVPATYAPLLGPVVAVTATDSLGNPIGVVDGWPAYQVTMTYDPLQVPTGSIPAVAVFSGGAWFTPLTLATGPLSLTVQSAWPGFYAVYAASSPSPGAAISPSPAATCAPTDCPECPQIDCIPWIVPFIVFLVFSFFLCSFILVTMLICPHRLRGRRLPYTADQQDAMTMDILKETERQSLPPLSAAGPHPDYEVPIADDLQRYGAEPPYAPHDFGPPVKQVPEFPFPTEDDPYYAPAQSSVPSAFPPRSALEF